MTIAPTAEQIQELASSNNGDAVIMVNLLRFKDRADIDGLSGEEAYARYAVAASTHLERVGGRILVAAQAQQSVIGPEDTEWDLVALVEYPSRKAFLAMATDPEYLKVHEYREAALADSRLIACAGVAA